MRTHTRPTFGTLFSQHGGYVSDKWMQFLAIYERELGAAVEQGQSICLLEIGVQNGGSLELWHEYLPTGSRVIGIDVDERCRQLVFPEGVEVLIADAGDQREVDRLLAGTLLDFIIDDGSHKPKDIIGAFLNLFPKLADGGKYIIEDLHASYWASHGGGLRKSGSSIEFLKSIVDCLHVDYYGDSNRDENAGKIDEDEMNLLKKLNTDISCIKFYDSIVVIEKYIVPKISRFQRIVSGSQMPITNPYGLAEAVIDNPHDFTFFGRSWDVIAEAALISAVQKMARETKRADDLAKQVAELRAEQNARGAATGSIQEMTTKQVAAPAADQAGSAQRGTDSPVTEDGFSEDEKQIFLALEMEHEELPKSNPKTPGIEVQE